MLVTSAMPGEGKTALATSLGRLAACSGKSVLLIDCDLRHPQVARSLGQTSEHGIVELWEGRATVGPGVPLRRAVRPRVPPCERQRSLPGRDPGFGLPAPAGRAGAPAVRSGSSGFSARRDRLRRDGALDAGRRHHHDGPLGEDAAVRGGGRGQEARDHGPAGVCRRVLARRSQAVRAISVCRPKPSAISPTWKRRRQSPMHRPSHRTITITSRSGRPRRTKSADGAGGVDPVMLPEVEPRARPTGNGAADDDPDRDRALLSRPCGRHRQAEAA